MNGGMADIVCCCSRAPAPQTMKRTSLLPVFLSSLLCMSAALGQSGAAPTAAAANTQADLVKLRIEHWKTSSAGKKDALAAVDSIQRNLQGTLPDIIAELRTSPEDLPGTFKLYRNLDAL